MDSRDSLPTNRDESPVPSEQNSRDPSPSRTLSRPSTPPSARNTPELPAAVGEELAAAVAAMPTPVRQEKIRQLSKLNQYALNHENNLAQNKAELVELGLDQPFFDKGSAADKGIEKRRGKKRKPNDVAAKSVSKRRSA